MKSKIGIIVLTLLVIGAVYLIMNSNKKGVDQTYLLPMDFKGCVVINYEVKGAPPLKIENNEIKYKVPKDGIVYTSSPMEFGWVNKKHSGSYQSKAFYVDKNGDIVKELPQEEIRFGATGSIQEEGEQERKYYYQIFGSEEVENQGCPQLK
ncbi:DUF6843 domain-containing protein [Siminovitchia sp. 179-K 8D1 HS]|uniref:DUF6843 domain-containing protein n=1 Tax=Siminovitchia sp. 179-K 8D1 HS TaxID=3142385 RepID=UPI0039A29B69